MEIKWGQVPPCTTMCIRPCAYPGGMVVPPTVDDLINA